MATSRGRRWTATFNPDESLDIDGIGRAHSLSHAARLISGGTSRRNGWRVWGVERDGEFVRLGVLRCD